VLPVYAVFIAAGLLAYWLALAELGGYLERVGLGAQRRLIEVGVHAACAVGVVLGRVARLNSWEPVVQPHSTLERVVVTLSWRLAPPMIVALFLVIWAAHAVTRGVVETAWREVQRGLARLGGARPHRAGGTLGS
jgi:uncharacterized membrane protein